MTAKEALETALRVMLQQFQSILDLKIEAEEVKEEKEEEQLTAIEEGEEEVYDDSEMVELLKTRIDTLDFSSRTERALTSANIRTLGGLIRKSKEELLAIDGFGEKSLDEVIDTLSTFKLTLKDSK